MVYHIRATMHETAEGVTLTLHDHGTGEYDERHSFASEAEAHAWIRAEVYPPVVLTYVLES